MRDEDEVDEEYGTVADAVRKQALRHAPAAVEMVMAVLLDTDASNEDRLKAAQLILEVSECLSL